MDTDRVHGCSVHTTCVHGPCRRAVLTVVWTGAREHGPRTRVSKSGDTYQHGPSRRAVIDNDVHNCLNYFLNCTCRILGPDQFVGPYLRN